MNSYSIKRVKRSRSIRLRVEPNGKVLVTAPPFAPHYLIERFVAKQQPWIERQQQRLVLKKNVHPVFDWEANIVSYLGQLLQIELGEYRVGVDKVRVEPGVLRVSPPSGKLFDAKKILVAWLKKRGEAEILERLPPLASRMEARYQKVRFSQQKSRWGSCSSNGTLSFNWRLIHYHPQVIDYVIVHELAHTLEHNHSEAFWRIVSEHIPDYKRHVALLKTQVLERL